MSHESKYSGNIEIVSMRSQVTMEENCNVLPKITTNHPLRHIECGS